MKIAGTLLEIVSKLQIALNISEFHKTQLWPPLLICYVSICKVPQCVADHLLPVETCLSAFIVTSGITYSLLLYIRAYIFLSQKRWALQGFELCYCCMTAELLNGQSSHQQQQVLTFIQKPNIFYHCPVLSAQNHRKSSHHIGIDYQNVSVVSCYMPHFHSAWFLCAVLGSSFS